MNSTDDLRIKRIRPLIAPAILDEEIPLDEAGRSLVRDARQSIANIIHCRDPRLLIIVGPCSVHDIAAVTEYAQRLAPVAKSIEELALVVMRVYFEKPRTTVGWKGFINDPYLDESFRVNDGLRGARQLLADITTIGLPCGTEFLDTTFGQYFTDFISWGAIGARTVESQVHRQLASGLSMPVGIKNATSGNIGVAIDALLAANAPHLFPSLTKEGAPALLETTGNPDCHLVMRGGVEPNYAEADVSAAVTSLTERNLETGVVVDCSHGNSDKDPSRQHIAALSVKAQRAGGQARLVGVMIESHLLEGRQDAPLVYGQSITDACLGWEDTHKLILQLIET